MTQHVHSLDPYSMMRKLINSRGADATADFRLMPKAANQNFETQQQARMQGVVRKGISFNESFQKNRRAMHLGTPDFASMLMAASQNRPKRLFNYLQSQGQGEASSFEEMDTSIAKSSGGGGNPPSALGNFIKGGVAGAVTVYGIMPGVAHKNFKIQQRQQQKRMQEAVKKGITFSEKPLVFNKSLRAMYRGAPGFAAILGPVTAGQNGLKGVFDYVLSQAGRRKLTSYEEMGTSVAGGTLAGLPLGIAELVMIQQRKLGLSFFPTVKVIRGEFGWQAFFAAADSTMFREGVTGGVLLGLAPLTNRTLQDWTGNEPVSRIGASLFSGFVATVLTQPIDANKTRRQSDLTYREPFLKAFTHPDAYAGSGGRMYMFTFAGLAIPFVLDYSDKIVAMAKARFGWH